MEMHVVPIGQDELSIARYVAMTSDVCTERHLKHEVTPMGTVVDGSLEECLEAVRESTEKVLSQAPRVIVSVTLDVRPGEFGRLDRKRTKIREIVHETGEKFDQSQLEPIHNAQRNP